MAEAKQKEQRFFLSDITNAELFHSMHKNKIRWCRDYGGWFIFNGKVWKRDNNDTIKGFAIDTVDKLAVICKEMSADPKNTLPYNHLRKSSSNSGLNAMIECSKPFFGCSIEDFDNKDYLFNCENGTINIDTLEFRDFTPEDMLTKSGYVLYDKDAICPLWDKFMSEVFLGDQNIIDYIQRVVGYSMTSLNKEQCMFILYGQGRNGKSKFIESIFNIMGDYAMNCPSSTLAIKNTPGIPNDIARLKGARMVTAIESNQNVVLDESLIKQMTGGDRITARFLNKEFFEFNPTFKIFFATNHKPRIRGTDTGIWRRINMIPFMLNLTKEQEDRELGEKLKTEASGIFNWMLKGYQEYKRIGLCTPEIVYQATEEYRENEDDIGKFIKEECILEKGAFVSSAEFCSKFEESMGYKRGNRSISDYMLKHGFSPKNDRREFYKGKRQNCFFGLKWAVDVDTKGKIVEWEE